MLFMSEELSCYNQRPTVPSIVLSIDSPNDQWKCLKQQFSVTCEPRRLWSDMCIRFWGFVLVRPNNITL